MPGDFGEFTVNIGLGINFLAGGTFFFLIQTTPCHKIPITPNSLFPLDYKMGRRSKDEISKTGFGGRGGAHHLPPPPRLQSVLLPWSSLACLSQKAKHLSWSNKGQVFSMFDFHYVCVWGSFASTKFINICANFDFMLRFVTDSPQFGVTNFPEIEF